MPGLLQYLYPTTISLTILPGYPVQNNPETVLRISLHPACEDLHTQPLLPNGAVFQLFRWKSANCGLLWGKCNHACYYCRCLWFHCICFSAVTGMLLIFLRPKLLVVVVIVVPLYLIRFSAVTRLLHEMELMLTEVWSASHFIPKPVVNTEI